MESCLDPQTLEELQRSIEIMPEALHENYVTMASELSHWGARYGAAVHNRLRTKRRLAIVEAEATTKAHTTLLNEGVKPTEALVNATLRQTAAWQVAAEEADLAEAVERETAAHMEALRTKRDMLISLGAHVRAEMQGDLVMRERSRSRREGTDG